MTVYPDAGTGNTTVDGYVQSSADAIWATIRAAAGNGSGDTNATAYLALQATTTQDEWSLLRRNIWTLDTSALTSGASISSAVFSLWFTQKSDPFTDSIALVGSTPANNNAIVNADYAQVGTTLYATAVAVSTITANDTVYTDITLNPAGIAAISKTSITKLGGRYESDRSNTEPSWSSGGFAYTETRCADEAGTDYDPKLVITYTVGGSTYTLPAVGGEFHETGTAADLLHAYLLGATGGTYALTGTAAGLYYGFTMAADAGSYTETGSAAGLLHGRKVTATGGSYAETGTAADLLHGYLLGAVGGTYAETGSDAGLYYGFTMAAAAGAYVETGTAADLLHARKLGATGGAYTETGTAADLLRGYLVTATGGAYAETGTSADLLHGYLVTANGGTYVVTGQTADLLRTYLLTATGGNYNLVGFDVTLTKGGSTYTLTADGGTYIVTGTSADLLHGWLTSADSGVYNLVGSDVTLTKAIVGLAGVLVMTVTDMPTNTMTITALPTNEMDVEV